jgi:hypothetical protein
VGWALQMREAHLQGETFSVRIESKEVGYTFG